MTGAAERLPAAGYVTTSGSCCYLREDALTDPLDAWLASAFAPDHLEQTTTPWPPPSPWINSRQLRLGVPPRMIAVRLPTAGRGAIRPPTGL